jgi:hypothetical protein
MTVQQIEVLRESGDDNFVLYDQIVAAWELVVKENEAQFYLVTPEQMRQWEDARGRIESKIVAIGEQFATNQTWDVDSLMWVKNMLLQSQRKTKRELVDEKRNKVRTPSAELTTTAKVSRVQSLIGRILRRR